MWPEIKSVATTILTIVVVFFVLTVAALATVSASLRLSWFNPPTNPPETVTEIWSSPDLVTWSKVAEVVATNVTLPADQPQEFFKARNRITVTMTNPQGQVFSFPVYSVWAGSP